MEEVLRSIFRRSKEFVRFDRPVGWIAKRSRCETRNSERSGRWCGWEEGAIDGAGVDRRSPRDDEYTYLVYRIYKKGREFEKERKGEGGRENSTITINNRAGKSRANADRQPGLIMI